MPGQELSLPFIWPVRVLRPFAGTVTRLGQCRTDCLSSREEDGSETCLRAIPSWHWCQRRGQSRPSKAVRLLYGPGGSDQVRTLASQCIHRASNSAAPAERSYGTTHCNNSRGARSDWSGSRRSPSSTTRSVSYTDSRGRHLRTPGFLSPRSLLHMLCSWFRPCVSGGDPVALGVWT